MMKNAHKNVVESIKRRYALGGLDTYCSIILKWETKRMTWEDVDCIYLIQDRFQWRDVLNMTQDFHDELSGYHFLKINYAPMNGLFPWGGKAAGVWS